MPPQRDQLKTCIICMTAGRKCCCGYSWTWVGGGSCLFESLFETHTDTFSEQAHNTVDRYVLK